MQIVDRENVQELDVRKREEVGDEGEQEENGQVGTLANVSKSFQYRAGADDPATRFLSWKIGPKNHHEGCHKRDCLKRECRSDAGGRDDHAGQRRSEDPGEIQPGAGERDGIGEITPGDERRRDRLLGRGHDGEHRSIQERRYEQVPFLHPVHRDVDRENDGDCGGDCLADHQHIAAIEPVDQHAGGQAHHEKGNTGHEADDADEKGGVAEFERDPPQRNTLHPLRDLREDGSAPEGAVRRIPLECGKRPAVVEIGSALSALSRRCG